MKPSAIVLLLLLILSIHILTAESKLQQQTSVDDDDDDEEWDEDDDDDEGHMKPEIDDDGRIYKNPRNSPSAMCPRDEEQAELLGQKCLRKCSTDEDCKSKKKKCRCDGACGMSCIKPDRECPELTNIDHGTLTVTGRLFGDRAHYNCHRNYSIVGLSDRICRADGHWTGSTPSCKNSSNFFCNEPPKVSNARHSALMDQMTFDIDSTVHYTCNHGYVTAGFQQAKCLLMDSTASWFGPDIICEPQKCGAPTDIANGWHAGECYTYDCRVSYHCADDYELVGRSEKVCLADGTWAPKELPQCVQITTVECSPPENPQHGKAVYTSYAYNSIVSYECKYGFTIIGVATRRCGADKRWSGQAPRCQEINCGSPGILYNGWIENIESGASIIFRCNKHMKLEGNTSSVCQIDGKWRYPVPQCLAPCVVPQIENGHIVVASRERDHINNVTVVEHGERLIVKCVQNYEFAANSTPVVCNNGTWTIIPTCSPARCKQMPKAPKQGIVIAPKTDHGMRAVFKCKDGFELVGGGPENTSTFVECRYGNWTGDIPHCIEVYCPFPGYIPHGKILLVGNMGVYDYRSYVKRIVNNKQIMYDCDRGYVLSEGPPGATCIGGNWSPKELPTCILGQHPRIRWNRRRRSLDVRKGEATLNYRRFIEFFKRISKRVFHMETIKGHDRYKHRIRNESLLKNSSEIDNGTVNEFWKDYSTRRNKTWVIDRGMIDFLKIVYRRLIKIDARRARNRTHAGMHELLNVMSMKFFRVDLTASSGNTSHVAKEHVDVKFKNHKEYVKLKRDFERIVRLYGRSVQWHGKHRLMDNRRRYQMAHSRNDKEIHSEGKKHKANNYYQGFYEFINNYMNEKLSIDEAQNATEELIKKMNINKFTVRNGTTFTIGDIYAFFKHIIEKKLNSSDSSSNQTVEGGDGGSNSGRRGFSSNYAVSTTSPGSLINNEIPATDFKDGVAKHRSKRIRKTSEEPSASYKRKLLSINHPLTSEEDNENTRYKRSSEFTLNELEAQQQSRSKRFLSPSELDNQIFLKNLYLNAYEEEYRANVKRSIFKSNRTTWPPLKRRKGNLERYEIK
ncbi:uncharacterized protein LOC107272574 isoform X2 [Cephus cinctus]|uniref:Uncharacterized protein LOC107272574 isoform X2 n=1 Tax=Cephus cinctus TaxID=211228 RepID=A0AAJ7C9X0_CEPCN|nr:uncharacterized protein LOC107272574 isoform X2 [Cephus cinctus]